MSTATKRDPKKWAAAKARAKAKMGGKHSARAMQLAVKYSQGTLAERHSGKKKSSNKLSKRSEAEVEDEKWKELDLGVLRLQASAISQRRRLSHLSSKE